MKPKWNVFGKGLILMLVLTASLCFTAVAEYTSAGIGQPSYVIITTSSIKNQLDFQFQTFCQNKQKFGFDTEIVTEETWGGGTGDTAAENIRNWLKSRYILKNICYVLLIGNPDPALGDVPMKLCHPVRRVDASGNVEMERVVPTDYYYADLDGDWDLNGDGFYGVYPSDFGPGGADNDYDVLVGRIPYYGNSMELWHIFDMINNYAFGKDSWQWRKKVLLPMNSLSDTYSNGYLGEAIRDYILVPNGYGTGDYVRIYDDASLSPEVTPCTATNVVTAWQTHHPGVVIWSTTGDQDTATHVMDINWAATLNSVLLTYPPFVFQSTSNNAYPENPNNLAYALVKNGAIGVIGPTRMSNYSAIQDPLQFAGSLYTSNQIAYEYTKRLIGGQTTGLAFHGLRQTIDERNDLSWRNSLTFNIYGDPSLSLEPKFIKTAAGSTHSLALTSNGNIYTWGSNNSGQLGDGTTGNKRNYPVMIQGFTADDVSCGSNFNVAYGKGSIWTWGDNTSGQLGLGDFTNRSTPTEIPNSMNLHLTKGISAGGSHGLAIDMGSDVWAWGANTYGQLGTGNTSQSNVPVKIPNFSNVSAISAGNNHSLALKKDGTVWAWGSNSYGQLGISTSTSYSSTPVQVTGLSNVKKIVAGRYHNLALLSDGTVRAWGSNSKGELGNGTTTGSYIPVTVQGLANVLDIKAGGSFSTALKIGGKAYAWGENSYGQCGLMQGGIITGPTVIPGLDNVLSIGNGNNYGFALQSDYRLFAWGYNYNGQLGDRTFINKMFPVEFNKLANLHPISVGSAHSNCIIYDKSINSWGYNLKGQLGNNSTTDTNVPVPTQNLANVISVASGEYHSLALTGQGEVYAWGYNSFGQLGTGDKTDRLAPVKVSGMDNVIAVACGSYHSMALKNDGSIWVWGRNLYGELGLGNNEDCSLPAKVTALSSITAITAGRLHSLAVKNDGTVWAWGCNFYGQLGDQTKNNQNLPVQVIGLNGVINITGGYSHSMALKYDGTVWSWGNNGYGQIGSGDNAEKLSPVKVLGSVKQIAAGYYYSLALRKDGTIRAWGRNNYGQLGTGNTTDSNLPTDIKAPNNVEFVAISTGMGGHSNLALRCDDRVLAWGYNGSGQLGNGNKTNQTEPVFVNLNCFSTNTINLGKLGQ